MTARAVRWATCTVQILRLPPLLTPDCVDLLSGTRASGAARSNLATYAETTIVHIDLPTPDIHIGPDPTVNEWNMAVVGYPLWLWSTPHPSVTATDTAGGFPLQLHATLASVTFAMGDGHSITCRSGTPYPPNIKPGTPSPDCGYSYQKASLPHGTYHLTATATWTVTWSALGETGTLTTTRTATRDLPVGELQAVVVR